MKTASMTQQQKREKAAELLGWKDLETKWSHYHQWERPDGVINYGTINDKYACLPDYPNDLNAMHEAEKVLTDEQYTKFEDTLWEIQADPSLTTRLRSVSATAAQRLDAWLEVMMEGES